MKAACKRVIIDLASSPSFLKHRTLLAISDLTRYDFTGPKCRYYVRGNPILIFVVASGSVHKRRTLHSGTNWEHTNPKFNVLPPQTHTTKTAVVSSNVTEHSDVSVGCHPFEGQQQKRSICVSNSSEAHHNHWRFPCAIWTESHLSISDRESHGNNMWPSSR
jgi:hypothetical protein